MPQHTYRVYTAASKVPYEKEKNLCYVSYGQNHPLIYKGCKIHKEIQLKYFAFLRHNTPDGR